MLLSELEALKARRNTGVLIHREKWTEILDWAIALTAHHEGADKAEPVADSEGWIEHTTNAKPVADGVMVEVILREDLAAGKISGREPAEYLVWNDEYLSPEMTIIKYRIIK